MVEFASRIGILFISINWVECIIYLDRQYNILEYSRILKAQTPRDELDPSRGSSSCAFNAYRLSKVYQIYQVHVQYVISVNLTICMLAKAFASCTHKVRKQTNNKPHKVAVCAFLMAIKNARTATLWGVLLVCFLIHWQVSLIWIEIANTVPDLTSP